MNVVEEVMTFWFSAEDSPGFGEAREAWFKSTPEFDAEIETRFKQAYADAASGKLDQLMTTAEGCLALIILLDQFPRNMFRGTAQAFATDTKALAISKHAIEKGFDRDRGEHFLTILYMPFQHSEALADQDKAIEIFATVGNDDTLAFATSHRDVIAEFGRFPHRNKTLSRETTSAEEEYLKDGRSWGQG